MASPQTDNTFVQDIRRYFVIIQRRRALILTSLVVSLLVALVYNYTARPMYQGTVQILIDRATPKVLPIKELVEGGGGQDFQTEYQLLRSRNLIEKVVDKLDLQKSPELQTGPTMSPLERLQRLLGKPPAPPVDSDGLPMLPAVAAVRSRLIVEPLPGGRLINLRFNAYSPVLAAQVANAVAEGYIEQAVAYRYNTTSAATEFLSEQMQDQKRKLEVAETALQEFRRKHGLFESDDKDGGGSTDRIQALETALMTARMTRLSKESLYNQLCGMSPAQLASSSSVITSPAVQEARQKLSDLTLEQARLADSLGDKHPDMVRIRNEVRAAEDKLRGECQNFLRGLQAEVQVAQHQEGSLVGSLNSVKREGLDSNSVQVEYGLLKRDVQGLRQLFNDLMNRAKETGLETELKSTNVRIIERAEVPNAPLLPRRWQNYRLAALLGIALGIGLTLFFEHLDNTIKTPEDVKELGLPFLGMVPDVTSRPSTNSGPRPSPVILKHQSSAVADAYRVLRTNLIFSSADAQGRALVVTSANPGEGKTTTVANLAASLALNGGKVLAVDADLRRPTMHSHFGVAKTPGLSDLIVGKCQASQAIQFTKLKGLQILPCGYIPPNPAELLGSASMRQVVEALRSHYDWVLIDSPPVLAMADTPILCSLVEGVVLVIAAEFSRRPAVQRAMDQIRGIGGQITGVVLNRVDLERNSYYYGQYYGEYYRSYYGEGKGEKRPAVGESVPFRDLRSGPRPTRRPSR